MDCTHQRLRGWGAKVGLLTLLFSDRKEEKNEQIPDRFSENRIRPVIDGRRKGIRESLEEQTMKMALAAKELIQGQLRYPNGEPIRGGNRRYHHRRGQRTLDARINLSGREWK